MTASTRASRWRSRWREASGRDEVKRTITCKDCQIQVESSAPTQLYCRKCSVARDLVRKRQWARSHPRSSAQSLRNAAIASASKEMAREAGRTANAATAESITWDAQTGPELLWMARVAVPFSYAMSKNALYRMVPQGHVYLRREAQSKRDQIAAMIRAAISEHRVAHNKVWLDILVQKPNHKGDAVNVVDTVCDAVKRAIPVDDRWFCIRRLDWQVVKERPQLIIGVGQDSAEDCQVCSFCGVIKPFESFGRQRSSHLGVARVCKQCRTAGRVIAKQRRVADTCN